MVLRFSLGETKPTKSPLPTISSTSSDFVNSTFVSRHSSPENPLSPHSRCRALTKSNNSKYPSSAASSSSSSISDPLPVASQTTTSSHHHVLPGTVVLFNLIAAFTPSPVLRLTAHTELYIRLKIGKRSVATSKIFPQFVQNVVLCKWITDVRSLAVQNGDEEIELDLCASQGFARNGRILAHMVISIRELSQQTISHHQIDFGFGFLSASLDYQTHSPSTSHSIATNEAHADQPLHNLRFSNRFSSALSGTLRRFSKFNQKSDQHPRLSLPATSPEKVADLTCSPRIEVTEPSVVFSPTLPSWAAFSPRSPLPVRVLSP